MNKESRGVTEADIKSFCNKIDSVRFLHTMTFNEDFTFEDAIKVLREHNLSGKPVNKLTDGLLFERPLMLAFLDECEKKLSELSEAKKLLRLAVDDFSDLTDMWRYADEVLKFIGND